MTAAEIAQLAAAGGVLLALVGLALIFSLRRTVRTLQRNQRIIFGTRGETDLVGHVADLDEQVGNLRMALEDLAVTAKDHEVRIDGCLARVGMVRFDAYEDLGGHQSTAVCFLDSNQNGVVVTTVVSRDFARMYVKTLKAGESDVPLAPEETEAFEQAKAKGAAPFTVRPRLEKLRQDRGMEYEQPEDEPESEGEDEDEQGVALRALERENRRRIRRGLPPLEALPPAPSTLGWHGLPTASRPDNGAEAAEGEDLEEVESTEPAERGPDFPAEPEEPEYSREAEQSRRFQAEETFEFEWEPGYREARRYRGTARDDDAAGR